MAYGSHLSDEQILQIDPDIMMFVDDGAANDYGVSAFLSAATPSSWRAAVTFASSAPAVVSSAANA